MEEPCSCVFCKQNRFFYHKQIGLKYDDAIVYEDDNVFVTPDISPVIKGHYLIITKNHIHGYANANEATMISLKKAIDYLKNKIYKSNEFTFFEHGAIEEGKAGASINHAHLHVLPGWHEISKIVDNTNVYTKKMRFTRDNFKEMAESYPYLWISNYHTSYLYSVDKLPSQFLRKIFMEAHETQYTYNWREEFDNQYSLQMYLETLNMVKIERKKENND